MFRYSPTRLRRQGSPATLAVGIFGGIVVWGMSKSIGRAQFSGAEGLVGEGGIVDGIIDGRGQVLVRGELWAAEADERLRKGTKVRVTEVHNLVLRVERTEDKMERA